MPSGRTHLRIEGALLFAWTGVGGVLLAKGIARPEAIVSYIVAYAFSMLFLSPDLDLARSRATRRWGIARVFWLPYAGIFRHRGASHHPLLGPASRIAYLVVLLVLGATMVTALTGRRWTASVPPMDCLVYGLLGLYLPNLTHVLADRLTTRARARRARKRL